jgi:class 3 adenylate cyclase/YHS domain-containing protein
MKRMAGIMMADLSGYTAVTEIHGDVVAMKLAEKYLYIARNSLIGKTIIHEITGDQLLMASDKADDLAMSAIALKQNAEKELRFLEIHFGLHYGPVIEKNGRLFGAVVNFTSRILGSAGVNKIICSREFIAALLHPERFRFEPQGESFFKNILNKAELFEMLPISGNKLPKFHIDPICHMRLSLKENTISSIDKETEYFFCSESCKTLFEEHRIEMAI